MRPSRTVVVLIAAVSVSACGRYPKPAAYFAYGAAPAYRMSIPAYTASVPAAYPAVATNWLDQPYTLDSGDRVRVVVYGQEGLNNSYVIDPSGMITLPLGGPVLARGLTKDQLAQAIKNQLAQGYIREPNLAVEIEAYRPFFILGEVNAPGQYPYSANLTVENAVATAGGFTARADRRKIVVTRTVAGRTFRGSLPANTPIRPGDTVQVEERWF